MATGTGDSPIAAQVLEQIGSQVDLGITLSTAAIGGILALMLQLGFHNNDRGKTKLQLSCVYLLPSSFTVQILSLAAGYVARGMLTGVTPILMQLPAEKWRMSAELVSLSRIAFPHSETLNCIVMLQIGSMLVSVLLLLALCWKNFRRLTGQT